MSSKAVRVRSVGSLFNCKTRKKLKASDQTSGALSARGSTSCSAPALCTFAQSELATPCAPLATPRARVPRPLQLVTRVAATMLPSGPYSPESLEKQCGK